MTRQAIGMMTNRDRLLKGLNNNEDAGSILVSGVMTDNPLTLREAINNHGFSVRSCDRYVLYEPRLKRREGESDGVLRLE